MKANAKEIITVKCFDAKYVQNHYFAAKCKGNDYLKMCLTPNM